MRILSASTGGRLAIFAGERHVDETIRTGIDPDLYSRVRNTIIAHRVLLQTGNWGAAISAATLVLDLNPRSVSAWVLLLIRRLMRRRTLMWGHLHPRAGANSGTAILRRTMRRLADGTILYGYDSVRAARKEFPNDRVWVAPNSLYRAHDMKPMTTDGSMNSVLYVGRLVADKKVHVLIEGFLQSGLSGQGVSLLIVGEGSERPSLEGLVKRLGGESSVRFLGQIASVAALSSLYASAVCSVSPGYVGLSLTQSMGFGVPMLISRDEPHAPEIELARFGGVIYFDTDSAADLSLKLDELPLSGESSRRQALGASVARCYSAEAMAEGLMHALENTNQKIGEDGWPKE